MASYYYQNLIKSVLEASTTDKWEIAVREWDIVDCQEDEKHLLEFQEKMYTKYMTGTNVIQA